nr:hypothetical protein [Haloferax sp. BAB-2207]
MHVEHHFHLARNFGEQFDGPAVPVGADARSVLVAEEAEVADGRRLFGVALGFHVHPGARVQGHLRRRVGAVVVGEQFVDGRADLLPADVV